MNPRLTIRRHGRALGVVGALVAVSATTTLALVAGTASAAPSESKPGTCIDNVNVRAEPSTDAKIVAVCTAGKSVKVAESKDGFVHLTDLEGWAAQEYISVNGAKPAPSEITPATPEPGAAPEVRSSADTPATGGDADVSDSDATGEDPDGLGTDEEAGDQAPDQAPDQAAPPQATPNRSPLSGLLG